MWIGDRVTIYTKEYKDIDASEGGTRWQLDRDWLRVRGLNNRIELSRDGSEAPSDSYEIAFNRLI